MSHKVTIALGIFLIIIGAFQLFSGYEAEDFTRAFLSWVAIIAGALFLLFGLARRGASVMGPTQAHQERSDHNQMEINALIKSMSIMTSADGMVVEQELAVFGSIYENLLGTKIDKASIQKIVTEAPKPAKVIKELSDNRVDISPLMKRKIVEASYLVMVSDLNVTQSEDVSLHKIGNALGFSNEEVDDIAAIAGT